MGAGATTNFDNVNAEGAFFCGGTASIVGDLKVTGSIQQGGAGAVVQLAQSDATLSNNGATTIARTFASGMSTLVGAWVQIKSEVGAAASPMTRSQVTISGTQVTVTGNFGANTATAAATIDLFAVGIPS